MENKDFEIGEFVEFNEEYLKMFHEKIQKLMVIGERGVLLDVESNKKVQVCYGWVCRINQYKLSKEKRKYLEDIRSRMIKNFKKLKKLNNEISTKKYEIGKLEDKCRLLLNTILE